MIHYEFTVSGRPRGKGRPRFTKNGHAYTDSKTRDYEAIVRKVFRKKYGMDAVIPEGYAILVRIDANYKVPDSDSRADKAAKLTGRIPVAIKPDADNIAKAIMDALNGEVWRDDAEVSSLFVVKRYSIKGNHVVVNVWGINAEAGESHEI